MRMIWININPCNYHPNCYWFIQKSWQLWLLSSISLSLITVWGWLDNILTIHYISNDWLWCYFLWCYLFKYSLIGWELNSSKCYYFPFNGNYRTSQFVWRLCQHIALLSWAHLLTLRDFCCRNMCCQSLASARNKSLPCIAQASEMLMIWQNLVTCIRHQFCTIYQKDTKKIQYMWVFLMSVYFPCQVLTKNSKTQYPVFCYLYA